MNRVRLNAPGAPERIRPDGADFLKLHRGPARRGVSLMARRDRQKIATQLRQGVQRARSALDAYIFSRKFKIARADALNILQILARELGHWNIEHIEVLPANQIQQQIERPLKGFKKNFKRIERNIEIARQLKERLAVQTRTGRIGRGQNTVQRGPHVEGISKIGDRLSGRGGRSAGTGAYIKYVRIPSTTRPCITASQPFMKYLLEILVIHIRHLRRAAFAFARTFFQIDRRLIPQQRAAIALRRFQPGLLPLELMDKLGNI